MDRLPEAASDCPVVLQVLSQLRVVATNHLNLMPSEGVIAIVAADCLALMRVKQQRILRLIRAPQANSDDHPDRIALAVRTQFGSQRA